MVHALPRAQYASAPAWIEMAQTSPECGCRSLDIITIDGVVPAPATTSVFAPKTLLTRSYAEEAATTQPVAPPVAS